MRMTKSGNIDARITADLDGRLSKLAAATGRSGSRLIAEAAWSYVAFVEAVGEGPRDLEAREVLDHEAVLAEPERRKRSPARSVR